MEEVRSYWQVTSIHHFCTTFGKQFKLPSYEPEELEQAFILDIPTPVTKLSSSSTATATTTNHISASLNSNNSDTTTHQPNSNGLEHNNGISEQKQEQQHDEDGHGRGEDDEEGEEKDEEKAINNSDQELDSKANGDDKTASRRRNGANYDDDEDYKPPTNHPIFQIPQEPQQQQQQNDEQENQHLLVKLAIALMKPHFNCKLTPTNWENYLKRLVETYWVELEHCPSPFVVPLISQDGVELTKNLTFNELPLSDKIDLFYALCDYRLWCEDATEALKDYSPEELRLESIGKDSQGYEYWYFNGARLFRENKELSQDIIMRKKRIKELEYKLIELEKTKIFREKEEKRKVELERARQQAAEAREARLAAKKQQEQEKAKELSNKRKKPSTPILPPRTGLRERRSSAASNNNESQTTRTTRSRLSQQQQTPQREETPQASAQKTTRGKSTRQSNQREDKNPTPDLPKRPPDEECKEELQKLLITKEDRAEAWSLHCESLESWESFATKFEKTKSTNEKYLAAHVNEYILPYIRSIYAKKAAEAKRKEKELLLSLASRRVSTRIISKRAQEEEEERQAQLHEAEIRRKKIEAEARLRAELEQEMRARKNQQQQQQQQQLLNGIASSTCSEDGDTADRNGGRYNLRQQQQQQPQHQEDQYEIYDTTGDDFDGIIHPDKLSIFYEALELVVDTVRTSKHAWPFVDPVPETVPGYYDLITEPMDLRKLRTKIEFREYRSLIELEKDFQLLVNNCERFNGPKNVYTKMVYKLWKSFRKNVRLYLQRDLHMDENETFIYPPVVAPPPPPPPAQAQPGSNSEPQQQQQEQPLQNHQDSSHLKQQEQLMKVEETSNHVSQTKIEPQPTESASPCPPQSSPVHSSEPPKTSPIHETTITTATTTTTTSNSPPPAKVARLEPSPVKMEVSCPISQEIPKTQLLPCNQAKAEPPLTQMGEEIIIDSYDVDCPDDNFFIWSEIKQSSDEKVESVSNRACGDSSCSIYLY